MALFKVSQLSTSIDFSVVVSVLVLVVPVAVLLLPVGVIALSSWSTLNLLLVWSSFCWLVSAEIFTVWTAFTWELAELWLLPDVIWLAALVVPVAVLLLPDVILLFWLLAAWLPVVPPPLAKLAFWLVEDWLLTSSATCRLIRLIVWLFASVVCWPVFSVAAWTGLPLIIIAPIAKTSSDEYNHNLPALYIL